MDATRADEVVPTGRPVSSLTYALCVLSALLLACQIWLIALWGAAIGTGTTQAGRVSYFLGHLPFALGRLGPFHVTVLSAAAGALGAIAGVLAARRLRDTARRLCIGLATANGLLVLWYVFTMM